MKALTSSSELLVYLVPSYLCFSDLNAVLHSFSVAIVILQSPACVCYQLKGNTIFIKVRPRLSTHNVTKTTKISVIYGPNYQGKLSSII